MSLIKWNPFWDPFLEMDKALARPNFYADASFVPAVDMYEDADNVIVETQLAGVDLEQLDISIEKDILCIKGQTEKKREVEEKNYYKKEIRRGSFYRSIPLPSHVLGEQAQAVAEAGVLKITIPKAPQTKPQTIKVVLSKK